MKIFDRFDMDFDKVEAYVASRLRGFISAAIALLLLVFFVALTVFFITLRGAEQTMVPELTGKDLTTALLELQVKELYPRIQLRYSQDLSDKGTILEQDPAPGSIVKAGRRIRLVVSRGAVVDRVENFIGQKLDDVKTQLQTLFSTSTKPLLALKEPPMYQFSLEPAGTILAQKPEGGTQLTGPTRLEFVVSRGPENKMVKVPDLMGLPFRDALDRIGSAGVNFVFSIRPAQANEGEGSVVSQLPAKGEVVSSQTRLAVVVAEISSPGEDQVFGLFRRELPEYPYPLALKLEALLPSGERLSLIEIPYLGGEFTLPYQVPSGSVLILSVLNRELVREEVR